MSVSAKVNVSVVMGLVLAVSLFVGVFVVARGDIGDPPAAPTTRVSTPSKPLDVIASPTPARSSVEVSRRLFASSPVAVLADSADRTAQRLAIAAAQGLGVPVMIDDPAAPAELERLGATTVLTFGRTQDVPGAQAVGLTPRAVDDRLAALRGTRAPRAGRRIDAIVVTRSVAVNAVAISTARIAGATVLELPHADPRRSPRAARMLAERPTTPVLALGTPFRRGFAYTLAVVRAGAEQPTGGYLALPGRHYTAMYGHPGAPQLGVLGEQSIARSVIRAKRLARKYAAVSRARFVPTFEVIATVASAGAGKDKDYSQETPVSTLMPLVDAAEKAGVYVILDLQPGRSDFLTQAKRYRSLLERPHVGLALDPEWRLTKKQKHLVQIGSVRVAEVNRVADWLAAITRRNTLPQKLFVVHQFSTSMIKGRAKLQAGHPELATVIHVDGHGTQPAKQGTWRLLQRGAPSGVFWGWKNFVDEDDPMLTAAETWRRVKPHPGLITYQ